MRRLYSRLVLCALFASMIGSGAIAQTNRKIEEVSPTKGEYSGKTFYTSSHAIIIGINQYKNLSRDSWLQYAEKDALDMREILIRSYGFAPNRIKLLLNDQATKANIEAALSNLSNGDTVHGEDRALIFFAGHGQTVKLPTSGEMGFLIPYDAKVDLEKPENRGGYLQTCIAMNSLWSYLEGSAAKHRLLIADACYGGLLAKMRALRGERPNQTLVNRLLARPAMQAITGGSAGETTQEAPSWGHGAFTYKLLEELKAFAANPDEVLSVSELASTLKISVGNLTDGKQNPQFGNYGGTEGDFLFVTTSPRQVPPIDGAEIIKPTPVKKIPTKIKPEVKPKEDDDPGPIPAPDGGKNKLGTNAVLILPNVHKGEQRKYKVHYEYQFPTLKVVADGTNIVKIKDVGTDGSITEESHLENVTLKANGVNQKTKNTPPQTERYSRLGLELNPIGEGKPTDDFTPEVQRLIDQLSQPLFTEEMKTFGSEWKTTVPNPLVSGEKIVVTSSFGGYLNFKGVKCVTMTQKAKIDRGDGNQIEYAMVFLLNPKTGQPEQAIAAASGVPSKYGDVTIGATIEITL